MDLTSTQKNLLLLAGVAVGVIWLAKRNERREEETPTIGATDFQKRMEALRREFHEEGGEREYETDAETGELTGRWRSA